MAVKVVHTSSGKEYVLIGTGYSTDLAYRPALVGGDLFPHQETAEYRMAAVCDRHGVIRWFSTEDLQVIEVDGIPVAGLFGGGRDQPEKGRAGASSDRSTDWGASGGGVPEEQCPACFTRVRVDQQVCPSCGLTLISEED